MHVETRFFFLFLKMQELRRIFEIAGSFLQVLLSTIFYKRSGTRNETFLTLSSLAYNIFSKNPAGFCLLINRNFKKSVDVIACFSCTVKKQKFKSIQDHRWIPLLFECYLSLSVWCVCFAYLHHFYQYYLCFAGRTQFYCI